MRSLSPVVPPPSRALGTHRAQVGTFPGAGVGSRGDLPRFVLSSPVPRMAAAGGFADLSEEMRFLRILTAVDEFQAAAAAKTKTE